MKAGAIIPQGNFSANTWVKIYENELGAPETSVTISNLDGNTDVMYRLVVRGINGYGSGSNDVFIRPNNDSGANYGYQQLYGGDTTAGASRVTDATYLKLGYNSVLNYITYAKATLYAKSGYVRTMVNSYGQDVTGTTVTYMILRGQSWNNTADNITSLVVGAQQTSGLGTGTAIELWKPLAKV